jgi:hypothetical protein
MPRTAATMFGLVLVAVSIGYNTMRWPIVWQMVGPAEERAPPHESASPPAAPPEQPARPLPDRPATAEPPASPTPPIPAKPVPDLQRAAGSAPTPIHAEPPVEAAAPAADENPPPAAIREEKPLVPVPRVRTVAGSAAEAGIDDTVRRLPPLDPSDPPPTAGAIPSLDGSIRVYPSTGIE